jgi:hypothetical protein
VTWVANGAAGVADECGEDSRWGATQERFVDEQTWAIAIAVLFLMGLVERYTPGRPIRPVEEEPPIRTGAFTRRLRLRALSRAATDPGGSNEKRKRNPGNVWEREKRQHHPLEVPE